MTGTQRRLTGRIQVPLPPGEAFRLFTPRGEQEWAPGWHPSFPAPAPDDTEPGTVFEAEVTYQLTALTGPASRKLREFADGYPAYLQSWQDAITAWIHNPGTRSGHPADSGAHVSAETFHAIAPTAFATTSEQGGCAPDVRLSRSR